MRITQRSDGYSVDPYAVRPGTSDALFARTIDATERPSLIKAQEAVTTAVPRIIDSVPPPLLGGTLGLTVLAVMVATHRVRFRLAPVLMSAVLLLPVSNYHASPTVAQAQTVETEIAEEPPPPEWFERRDRYSRDVEPMELSDPPEIEDAPERSRDFLIPPEITEGLVPLVEMVVPDELTDEQQLRILRRRAERLMEEIRQLRIEQELEERIERSARRFQRL
ncbi:MAG TPA: hypothetical protein VFS56_12995 [Gemmatimonadaceae bacterium]|nr:hypothetical protein [Gemmatimonadaceae bacterium]